MVEYWTENPFEKYANYETTQPIGFTSSPTYADVAAQLERQRQPSIPVSSGTQNQDAMMTAGASGVLGFLGGAKMGDGKVKQEISGMKDQLKTNIQEERVRHLNMLQPKIDDLDRSITNQQNRFKDGGLFANMHNANVERRISNFEKSKAGLLNTHQAHMQKFEQKGLQDIAGHEKGLRRQHVLGGGIRGAALGAGLGLLAPAVFSSMQNKQASELVGE